MLLDLREYTANWFSGKWLEWADKSPRFKYYNLEEGKRRRIEWEKLKYLGAMNVLHVDC